MDDAPKVRRRSYFLRESSQPHMILALQAIYLLLVFFSSIVLYVVMQYNANVSGDIQQISGRDTLQLLLPTLITLNVVGLVVTSVISVFYTHRIAGPIYRLRHIMRDIGDGNLTQFAAFRKDDELQELARAFDDMVIGLNRRMYRVRGQADAVIDAVSKVPAEYQTTGLTYAANQIVAEMSRLRLMSKEDLDSTD